MAGSRALERWSVTFFDCENEVIESFECEARKKATPEDVVVAAALAASGQWERAKAVRSRRTLPILKRGECERLVRPCYHTHCHHALPLGECSLDHAMKGSMTLAEVGDVLGISRERARQIEAKAMIRIREEFEHRDIQPTFDEVGDPWEAVHEGGDSTFGVSSGGHEPAHDRANGGVDGGRPIASGGSLRRAGARGLRAGVAGRSSAR